MREDGLQLEEGGSVGELVEESAVGEVEVVEPRGVVSGMVEDAEGEGEVDLVEEEEAAGEAQALEDHGSGRRRVEAQEPLLARGNRVEAIFFPIEW